MASDLVVSNGNGITPQPGGIVRSGLDGVTMEVRAEQAAISGAKRVEAVINAMFVTAARFPRDIETVRVKLLKACQRPGFADAAIYSKPVGRETIEDLSIRFAEAAIQEMGNMRIETTVTYEDALKRKVLVEVIDCEKRIIYGREISFDKTVERQDPKGREVVGERVNSYGKPVYTVIATDDELTIKQAAMVSKVIRTEGLRLLPPDIKDECREACFATLAAKNKQDPEAAKKKLIDGFAKINVLPANLREYLGTDIAQVSPAQVTQLRGLYQAINEGETSWSEVMEKRRAASGGMTQAPPEPEQKTTPAQPAQTQAPASGAVIEQPKKEEPKKADEPPAHKENGEVIGEDPIDLEKKRIRNLLGEAKTKNDVRAVASLIKNLPEQDQLDLTPLYSKRLGELK